MSQQYNVAILGATGAVGETILEVLQERKFPVGDLFLLASERSEGKTSVSYTHLTLPTRSTV